MPANGKKWEAHPPPLILHEKIVLLKTGKRHMEVQDALNGREKANTLC